MQLVKDFPKTSRHSLGSKIDQHFLNMLGHVYGSVYQPPAEKSVTISKAISELDMVKFFLSIAWESAILQNNHYVQISADLDEVGRMLGGWKKGVDKTIQTKNSR